MSTTFTVTVTNVDPVLTIRGDETITEGDTVNLSDLGGTTFSDVGTADTHTATVDWGDGTVDTVAGAATSHRDRGQVTRALRAP